MTSNDDMTMETPGYLTSVKHLQISKKCKTLPSETINERKRSEYRSLADTLLYLGQAVLPQPCFVASKLEHKVGCLHVGHLVDASSMLNELQELKASITFSTLDLIADVMICSMADVSHGGVDHIYGQSAAYI